ncbi:transposase [Sinomonas sp. R1AF57]|uniref:transposase n=1 Tax=Sinomonas sp. R1AF57 TaxID=2020377 RepID=UPI001C9C695F
MFIDRIRANVRDGQAADRPIYIALAVTTEGNWDILGGWAGDGGKGAKYWQQVLAEIRNRLENVLRLVCDDLKGLPDAVGNVCPATIVQTCIVHLMLNSFRYASRQDWGAISRGLKSVYDARTGGRAGSGAGAGGLPRRPGAGPAPAIEAAAAPRDRLSQGRRGLDRDP